MTIPRLWLRMNMRILALFGLVTAATSVGGVLYASTVACDSTMQAAQCARFLVNNPPSTGFTLIVAILPIVLGLVLGIDAVGRELDDHTAAFAWSIAGDRRRWLAERVLPGAITTAVLGLVCGAVNAVLVAMLNPGHDIATSFVGYGLWGPILLSRGLCAYVIGLVFGVLLGRVIPAIALGLIAVTVVIPLALVVGRSFEPARILPNDDPSIPDALSVEVGVLTPDGRLGSWFDCVKSKPAFPNDPDGTQQNAWELAHCSFINSYLSGSQMPAVELRESAALAVAVVACGGVAFAVVANRRP